MSALGIDVRTSGNLWMGYAGGFGWFLPIGRHDATIRGSLPTLDESADSRFLTTCLRQRCGDARDFSHITAIQLDAAS